MPSKHLNVPHVVGGLLTVDPMTQPIPSYIHGAAQAFDVAAGERCPGAVSGAQHSAANPHGGGAREGGAAGLAAQQLRRGGGRGEGHGQPHPPPGPGSRRQAALVFSSNGSTVASNPDGGPS